MSEAWLTIAGLACATVAIKASGPLAVGRRELHPRALRVIALLAPALLTALVLVETFAADGRHPRASRQARARPSPVTPAARAPYLAPGPVSCTSPARVRLNDCQLQYA